MPFKTGRGTYKGYQSPNTSGWPKEIRDEVRHTYGAFREKNPGEDHAIKSRGARIAWAAARRKYPRLYSDHQRQQRKIERETRKEMREHPWAGKWVARRIASDHIQETSSRMTKKTGTRKKVVEHFDMEEARISHITGG
jgi:hypothetical protein